MDPILISIGPLALRWYGVLIALGVVLGARLDAARRARARARRRVAARHRPLAGRRGHRRRAAGVRAHQPVRLLRPGRRAAARLYVWEGGLSIHGAVWASCWCWPGARACKGYDVWRYLDVLAPVAAFGIIGGRIGNFMNGTDTGGRLTNWAIGFTWPEPGTPTLGAFGRLVFGEPLWLYGPPVCRTLPFGDPCVVHLTPAYGALVGVRWSASSPGRWRARARPARSSSTWCCGTRCCAACWRSRSATTRCRAAGLPRPVGGVGLLTLTQVFSVPLVLIALYLLWVRGAGTDR
jgi:phosphatidylglycerol---prolipoprotein diacylglyceryl transferase